MLGGMMTLPTRHLPVALTSLGLAFGLGLGLTLAPLAALAQSPAELPPASYTGLQYVDSKGCVFIRAGVDGSVTWVPRISRSRKQVCGFQPTAVAGAPAAPVAADAPLIITAPQPENGPAAAATTTVAAAPAPAPAPVARTTTTTTASRPAAAPVRYAAVPVAETAPVLPAAPAPVAPARMAEPQRLATACPNLSPVAQQYMRPGRYEISCGPSAYAAPSVQTESYRPPVPGQVVTPGEVPAGTRVMPKHVYEQRYAVDAGAMPVPEGYVPAFTDGRLNPHRAEGTFEGMAAMELIWTRTVPRRLVEKKTGRDVTADYPWIQPGQTGVFRAPVISTQSRSLASPAPAPVAKPAAGAPLVASMRSDILPVVPAAATAATPYRFVQVGTFGEPGNAQAAAARLQAAGYPVRIGSSGRFQVVLIGPFGSEVDMAHALSAARASGFDDAFPRN